MTGGGKLPGMGASRRAFPSATTGNFHPSIAAALEDARPENPGKMFPDGLYWHRSPALHLLEHGDLAAIERFARNRGVTGYRFAGQGYRKAVLDIGNGVVMRIHVKIDGVEVEAPDYYPTPDVLKPFHCVDDIGGTSIELMEQVRPVPVRVSGPAFFLADRARRRGLYFPDAKFGNVGVRRNGQLVIIDGNVRESDPVDRDDDNRVAYFDVVDVASGESRGVVTELTDGDTSRFLMWNKQKGGWISAPFMNRYFATPRFTSPLVLDPMIHPAHKRSEEAAEGADNRPNKHDVARLVDLHGISPIDVGDFANTPKCPHFLGPRINRSAGVEL